MTMILISNNPDNLEKALREYERTATVEAEYGDRLVEGSIRTLAHHGPRSKQPCPCLLENIGEELHLQAIGISHVDLDTIGGIMALMSLKPKGHEDFWKAAAFADVNGPHRLHEIMPSEEVKSQLWAYWAYSEANRVYPPRDGSVADVAAEVWWGHIQAVKEILRSCSQGVRLISAGMDMRLNKIQLEKYSFIDDIGDVAIRVTSGPFVNSLYTHGKDVRKTRYAGVSAYNNKTKAVTISLERPIEGVSCREIVQFLWGKDAGGHDGIADSPRGEEMSRISVHHAAVVLHCRIRLARKTA